jgi:hypothetical protein
MQTIFCDKTQCVHNFCSQNPHLYMSLNNSTCTHPCPTIPLLKMDKYERTCLNYEENQSKDEEISV